MSEKAWSTVVESKNNLLFHVQHLFFSCVLQCEVRFCKPRFETTILKQLASRRSQAMVHVEVARTMLFNILPFSLRQGFSRTNAL